jgi:ribose transport system permease protein
VPLQRLLALAALVLLLIFFSAIAPPFRTWDNFVTILLATAVNGVLAMGVTFVIISGGIDLSVGTMMTLCTIVLGLTLINADQPVSVAILAALIAGALAGTVNGTVVAKLKVPPFIATLGMLNMARGLALVLSEMRPIHFAPRPEYWDLLMGTPLFGIPTLVYVLFGAAIVAHFVLTKTVLGRYTFALGSNEAISAWPTLPVPRYTFALGSNEEATRLSGVNVDRWKIAVYSVCGLMAGLAAVLIAARMNSAQPAVGMGYELDAIAAAVIGGTSLRGGEGSIVGTIIGAFIISTLAIGLAIVGVPDEWRLVVTGLVIIGAVWLDILRRRSRV